MSVIMVACNNINAQTLESINHQRKSGGTPQIMVGDSPMDIEINNKTNKIYVANVGSGTVSVIDDTIEDKIMGYYVDAKLSEDHRQLLKDKISEYYGSVKGSESGA